MTTNKNFKLTDMDIESFDKNGFIVLRNFLSDEFISYMEKMSDSSIESPSTNYGSSFNRLKYDVGNNDEVIFKLIQDKIFKDTLSNLTKRDLFFIQGLSFELQKKKDKGFPWRVGTQSFGCQRKDDYGCIMWIPFCEINPKKQRGGMKYISKEKLSGEFIYQYINLLPERLDFMKNSGEQIDYDYFSNIKNDIINSSEISNLLDYHAEEDYFNPKDVILFDKYVLHRSVKLEDGEINSRLAFALRFVDVNCKYDLNRALLLEYPKENFNYGGSSNFNIDVCKKDGEKLIDSWMFTDTLKERSIINGNS